MTLKAEPVRTQRQLKKSNESYQCPSLLIILLQLTFISELYPVHYTVDTNYSETATVGSEVQVQGERCKNERTQEEEVEM